MTELTVLLVMVSNGSKAKSLKDSKLLEANDDEPAVPPLNSRSVHICRQLRCTHGWPDNADQCPHAKGLNLLLDRKFTQYEAYIRIPFA